MILPKLAKTTGMKHTSKPSKGNLNINQSLPSEFTLKLFKISETFQNFLKLDRLHRKPLEQRKKSKSSKSTSNPRTQQRSKKRKNCENEDPNCLPPTSAKLKYFSKKNKSKEAPRHKASTSKTVEVFLFENKEQKKDKTKKNGRQISPATKTLETMVRKYRYKKDPQFASFSYNGYTPSSVNKHSSSKPLISLPVYQKYINKVKKADMSSNLKDLHRKMHSCVLDSFNEKKRKSNSKSKSHQKISYKASSSFIFRTKSPLSKTKTCNENFIMKNKKNLKSMSNTDECKKKQKNKRFKSTLSKKSIGSSTHKTSGYSTSKNKGSLTTSYQKFRENSSVIKYGSFVSTAKVSPTRVKSIERVPKKSQRKLDMNSRKPSCGKRKKSCSSKAQTKAQVSIASHYKNKSSYRKFTRNQFTSEALDSGYGSLIDSYTEMLSKRKNCKKPNKKEASQSFHAGLKKKSKHKRSFLEPNIQTVTRLLGKETFDFNGISLNGSTDGYKKATTKRLHCRRNTTQCTKKNSVSKPSKPKKATPSVKCSFHENYMTVHSVTSSCKNMAKKDANAGKSEVTSNESTPRIGDEDVVVNTITGGYGETIKNSFCSKNISFKNKFR
ncbi:unnamed protein product [Moneuplotes crassus]|uniref:Uncharacterized protein n=1 Tax=Euplotes crassus TaxID=5936 RepID=A0AAD1XIB6_EUPCR|nr:unnamed protein product [Moneuplotes crassus]